MAEEKDYGAMLLTTTVAALYVVVALQWDALCEASGNISHPVFKVHSETLPNGRDSDIIAGMYAHVHNFTFSSPYSIPTSYNALWQHMIGNTIAT